jgi:hypothetical protein
MARARADAGSPGQRPAGFRDKAAGFPERPRDGPPLTGLRTTHEPGNAKRPPRLTRSTPG